MKHVVRIPDALWQVLSSAALEDDRDTTKFVIVALKELCGRIIAKRAAVAKAEKDAKAAESAPSDTKGRGLRRQIPAN